MEWGYDLCHLWDNSHSSSHSFHWVLCHPNVQSTWILKGIRLVMKFKRTLYTSFKLNLHWWLTNLLHPSFKSQRSLVLRRSLEGHDQLSFEMLVDCRCPHNHHYEHSLISIMWIAFSLIIFISRANPWFEFSPIRNLPPIKSSLSLERIYSNQIGLLLSLKP